MMNLNPINVNHFHCYDLAQCLSMGNPLCLVSNDLDQI